MARSSVIVLLFCLVHTDVHMISLAAAQVVLPGVSSDTGFTGDINAITNLKSLSLPCRSSADILTTSDISAHFGNRSCITIAARCTTKVLSRCIQQQLTDRSGPLIRECAAQNKKSGTAVVNCLLPIVLKNCPVSGCSSCPSSRNAPFGDKCKSRGGQLCRQTYLLFGHRVQGQSMCAPSVCSSQLLATSVAKVYSNITRHALKSNPELQSFFDNEISCGTAAQSYTVRSSAPDKAVSGSRSSQAANSVVAVTAVLSALAVLHFL